MVVADNNFEFVHIADNFSYVMTLTCYGSPSAQNFSVGLLWGPQSAYSATLLRVNSCRSPSVWQQEGGGLRQTPGGQKLHEELGYQL